MREMDFNNPYSRKQIKIGGRHYNVDDTRATSDDIRRIGRIKNGRQIMMEVGDSMVTMQDNRAYDVPPNARFKDAPAVRKAYSEDQYTYFEHRRSNFANAIIRQQLADLESKLFRQEIIVDNIDNPIRVLIERFKLPPAVRRLNSGLECTALMIMLPDQYPDLPPVGFYLPEEIRAGSHLHSGVFHGAYHDYVVMNDWKFKWYCSTIVAETWSPAYIRNIEDWRKGDNLWQVFTLIKEVLSDFSDD